MKSDASPMTEGDKTDRKYLVTWLSGDPFSLLTATLITSENLSCVLERSDIAMILVSFFPSDPLAVQPCLHSL